MFMFNFAEKYASQIANADFDRVDRDFIEAGSHIVKITDVACIVSQNTGNEMVILEGEIVASDTLKVGDLIKHIWALKGVEMWKSQRNLSQLKSLVLATLPEEINDITPEVVTKALDNSAGSAIVCGANIRVEAKKKVSKNEREYLSYSFMRAPVVDSAPSVPWDAVQNGEGWDLENA